MILRISVLIYLLFYVTQVSSLDLDHKLDLVKNIYALNAKNCTDNNDSNIDDDFLAGKLLFESKALSGDRNISCQDCHLDHHSSTDGLPIAIGVGGKGNGLDRYVKMKGTLVQRNVLSLIGRGDDRFTSFFWDGKVQISNGLIITEFGNKISDKFSTPLEVASILPLLSRDEFIGKNRVIGSNDIQKEVEDKIYYERYVAVSKALRNRFVKPKNNDDKEIAAALIKTGIELENFELADIGILLSVFIKTKFSCNKSSWDEYLSGNKSALNENQKKGAVIFFGKGRCSSCHSGEYFSDFEFHSIGLPQGSFGPHTRNRDIGRAEVTHEYKDMYKFRTPPLTDVINTPPYGHNGSIQTLYEIVVQHFNPLSFYIKNKKSYKDDFFNISKLMDSRDPILSMIDITSEDEINYVIEFLGAL